MRRHRVALHPDRARNYPATSGGSPTCRRAGDVHTPFGKRPAPGLSVRIRICSPKMRPEPETGRHTTRGAARRHPRTGRINATPPSAACRKSMLVSVEVLEEPCRKGGRGPCTCRTVDGKQGRHPPRYSPGDRGKVATDFAGRVRRGTEPSISPCAGKRPRQWNAPISSTSGQRLGDEPAGHTPRCNRAGPPPWGPMRPDPATPHCPPAAPACATAGAAPTKPCCPSRTGRGAKRWRRASIPTRQPPRVGQPVLRRPSDSRASEGARQRWCERTDLSRAEGGSQGALRP